jgi:hypothetical protein
MVYRSSYATDESLIDGNKIYRIQHTHIKQSGTHKLQLVRLFSSLNFSAAAARERIEKMFLNHYTGGHVCVLANAPPSGWRNW